MPSPNMRLRFVSRGSSSSGGGGGGTPTTPNSGYYTNNNELLLYAKHSSYQDSAGTTLVTADGQPIGRLTDFSSNNRHAKQSTAGNRPVRASAGGLIGAKTDGGDSVVLDSAITIADTSGFNLYMVLRLPAANSKFTLGTTTAGTLGYALWNDGNVYIDTNLAHVSHAKNFSGGGVIAVRLRRIFTTASPGSERTLYFASSQAAEFSFGQVAGDHTFLSFFFRNVSGGQASDTDVELLYLHLIGVDINTAGDATESAYINSEFGVTLPAY